MILKNLSYREIAVLPVVWKDHGLITVSRWFPMRTAAGLSPYSLLK